MENPVKTNRWAIVCFVSGLISFLSWGIILFPLFYMFSGNVPEPGSPIHSIMDWSRSVRNPATIVSMVTGLLALREIRKKGGMEKGKTLARVGIALGAGLPVLLIAFFLLFSR
jgi:hypothetical protein